MGSPPASSAHAEMLSLGIEILSVAILAVKPDSGDRARAGGSGPRGHSCEVADDAVYARRNSAVEQERAIKQSELDTEIAVEQKKRAIRETQMDAEASVQAQEARTAAGGYGIRHRGRSCGVRNS